MVTAEQIRQLSVCKEAKRYFSAQAEYWRRQGDHRYAAECEADLARWSEDEAKVWRS